MRMQNELMHYASKYYDPVKAHEYYMRTRELKGRRSMSRLNDEGKEIWTYTKNEIGNEKKQKLSEAQETRRRNIETLRQQASETRERISSRLKELNQLLNERSKQQKDTVRGQKQSKIDSLRDQTIPKGLSKEEKARRRKQINEQIDRIRGDAKVKTSEITESTKTERKVNRESASSQRKQVAEQLKTVIAAAREAYNQAKTSLDNSYENLYQAEFDKIESEYGKKGKKRRR